MQTLWYTFRKLNLRVLWKHEREWTNHELQCSWEIACGLVSVEATVSLWIIPHLPEKALMKNRHRGLIKIDKGNEHRAADQETKSKSKWWRRELFPFTEICDNLIITRY